MTSDLRVLLVEDCESDALLILRQLQGEGYQVISKRLETRRAFEAAVRKEPWDLIISDYRLPEFSGVDALEILRRQGKDIPFILVSGYIGEETAVAAMKAGAHDYVMKDNLARLVPAVERELKEAQIRRTRAEAQAALHESHRQLAEARDQLERRVKERTSQLTEANEALQRQIEERKRLEGELLESAERERRRIGIDLHDELGQLLNGLSYRLKSLELRLKASKSREAAEARKLQKLLAQAMDQAHNVAKGLATMDWKGDSLGEALMFMAKRARNLFAVSSSCKIAGKVPKLPPRTLLELYKIAQESLTNAIKHGRCKRVLFQLATDRCGLTLTIKNDGIPFPSDLQASERMGLHIMRYRAGVISASLEIRANGRNGTIVTCHLPAATPAVNHAAKARPPMASPA